MEDEESAQGHLSRSRSTFEKSGDKITDKGGLIQDFDTHCRRPESPLVPGQEVPCKAEGDHNTEQRQSDTEPSELRTTRILPWRKKASRC